MSAAITDGRSSAHVAGAIVAIWAGVSDLIWLGVNLRGLEITNAMGTLAGGVVGVLDGEGEGEGVAEGDGFDVGDELGSPPPEPGVPP